MAILDRNSSMPGEAGNALNWASAKQSLYDRIEREAATPPSIPGVPIGCRLVRFGVPIPHVEFYLATTGKIRHADGAGSQNTLIHPIIEAANVYNVCDLTTIPIPDGYERAGETIEEWFRVPNGGDPFLRSSGSIGICTATYNDFDQRRIILRKIAPKTKQVLVVEYDNPSNALKELYSVSDSCPSQYFVCLGSSPRLSRLETRPV